MALLSLEALRLLSQATQVHLNCWKRKGTLLVPSVPAEPSSLGDGVLSLLRVLLLSFLLGGRSHAAPSMAASTEPHGPPQSPQHGSSVLLRGFGRLTPFLCQPCEQSNLPPLVTKSQGKAEHVVPEAHSAEDDDQ